jgi:hypothetical protein
VPIGIGLLRWGETTTIGVLLDESLADTGNEFVSALRAALAEVVDDVPNFHPTPPQPDQPCGRLVAPGHD